MNTIIILLLTKDMIVSDHNNSCWSTNVPGHRRVWAQSCLGTNVSGHKSCLGTNRVWAQSCLGTIVSGHNRVWAQSCLSTVVWAQSCMGSNVVEPKFWYSSYLWHAGQYRVINYPSAATSSIYLAYLFPKTINLIGRSRET